MCFAILFAHVCMRVSDALEMWVLGNEASPLEGQPALNTERFFSSPMFAVFMTAKYTCCLGHKMTIILIFI